MDNKADSIENDVQDRNSEAWIKLCAYIEQIRLDGAEEFNPIQYLGSELYFQIYTLPESIGTLKTVKKMCLYGSRLKRIPPEIGDMEALESFDPYTSYQLHWFPYEITRCKHLKDSRVSTRVLYGNFKNRMEFPDLNGNPVRYAGETVKCSVCQKEMTYAETEQWWVSLWVGTDVLPLLVNLCSVACKSQLPRAPGVPEKYGHFPYIEAPHKGGSGLVQPPAEAALL